ncbi:MAG: DegT/DnrJ/EryC1/StrS family aminotransferase [Leadbetterella sp.]
MSRVNVTKSFLPPKEEYFAQLSRIWDSGILTNNGPLVIELEKKLQDYIQNPYLSYINNGTVAIQIALKAMDIKGSVITTPFSYCATTTSLIWEGIKPVFVDILPDDLNIDPDKIEAAIQADTTAILATHVYGNPCQVEKIEQIAKKHNLKVIYDAAHAFGVDYKGKSLLAYGDVSTCSFHATKVFHTIEGGSIVCNSLDLDKKIRLMRSFGHIQDEYYLSGINGKNSEFHAAMGLVNLGYLPKIIEGRKTVTRKYDQGLKWVNCVKPTEISSDISHNFAYYPIILNSEKTCLEIINALNSENIYPRRYFYPSLNTLPYLEKNYSCPNSESISNRVISLPLYPDLEDSIIEKTIDIVNRATA